VLIVATEESQEVAERFVPPTPTPLIPIAGGVVGPPEQHAGENLD
jgi:hypothetical protein